jgi:hypothetical protein
VVATTLRSRINQRSYVVGTLTTPSLRELRDEAATVVDGLRGRLRVSNISGDVRSMHGNAAHHGALFQVASQFNLLEMTGPHVSPEDGVTRYAHDRTQGPACALAAGAATVYRSDAVGRRPERSSFGYERVLSDATWRRSLLQRTRMDPLCHATGVEEGRRCQLGRAHSQLSKAGLRARAPRCRIWLSDRALEGAARRLPNHWCGGT